MTPDALSQEEIDALLKGSTGGEGEGGSPQEGGLTPDQTETLEKYGDKMAQTQSDMIGTYLGDTVSVDRQSHSAETADAIASKISGNIVVCSFLYEGSLNGKSLLLFTEKDACKVGGTMVGEPEASEFSELIMDAFKEICNTIVGNLNTGLSNELGMTVSIKDMEMEMKEFSSALLVEKIGESDLNGLITYSLKIGEDDPTACWQIFSKELIESINSPAETAEPTPAPKSAPAAAQPATQPQAAPVEFEPLAQETTRTSAPANLDLIMDIGLEIRVELGRTNMKIRDILNLGGGSVVELDKLAGEPVDLLVNDVIFAKGEVVVIDENFGVRITEILTLQERIKTLGELKD